MVENTGQVVRKVDNGNQQTGNFFKNIKSNDTRDIELVRDKK